MTTINLPLSLPVKIDAQDSQITFTQTDDGYFMNLSVKVELPVKELIDSLMTCSDKVRDELSSLPQLKANPDTKASLDDVHSPGESSRPASVVGSSDESTACDRVTPAPSYCSLPFPRIDSPYRAQGRWRSNSATYFLRDRAGSAAGPVVKSQLSANAPVFRPSMSATHAPAASPFTQCSLAGSDTVWDLPGLPSPLVEASSDPFVPLGPESTPTPVMVQSILQRGISNQCKQM